MKDISEATPYLKMLIEHLRQKIAETSDPDALRWIGFIRLALRSPQIRGGMSGWASLNNSKTIEIVQAKYSVASGRIVEVSDPMRSSLVWYKFNAWFGRDDDTQETKKYRGILTVASCEATFVGFDKQYLELFVYHVVDEPQKVGLS